MKLRKLKKQRQERNGYGVCKSVRYTDNEPYFWAGSWREHPRPIGYRFIVTVGGWR